MVWSWLARPDPYTGQANPTPSLDGVSITQETADRPHENQEIEFRGPVLDVMEVETRFFLNRQARAS